MRKFIMFVDVMQSIMRIYIIRRAYHKSARSHFYYQLFFGLTTSSLGFIILYRLFKEENLSFRRS